MSKLARTALVTSVGLAVGTYSWVLARKVAYSTLDVEPEDLSWATPDSPRDDYDLNPDAGYSDLEEWEDHMAECPNCAALGLPGVMNPAKLNSIAAWIDYSDGLLERLLSDLDDCPEWMTPDQLEYIQGGLGMHDNAMVTDLRLWADMIEEGRDPQSP